MHVMDKFGCLVDTNDYETCDTNGCVGYQWHVPDVCCVVDYVISVYITLLLRYYGTEVP